MGSFQSVVALIAVLGLGGVIGYIATISLGAGVFLCFFYMFLVAGFIGDLSPPKCKSTSDKKEELSVKE